jgi:hypothetical protein
MINLTWNTGSWFVTGGSGQLQYSGAFASSIATSGYQKLSSGLIIQWGVTTTTAANTPVLYTFPLAFPTNALGVFPSIYNTAGAAFTATTVLSPTKTQVQIQSTYSGSAQINVFMIGY